jgi:hypothetical protein
MPSEAYGAREASRVNRSLADDPDDRNWDVHIRRVQQDAALKEVRRTTNPNMAGVVRTLIDKVGRQS